MGRRKAFWRVGTALLVPSAIAALARLARRPRNDPAEDQREATIDEAGRDSFPASDPPSWTLG